MPYDPNALPYIINTKELPANQAAAGQVQAKIVGTANQWCQSPYFLPNWGSMNVAPNVTTTPVPGLASPVSTPGANWPDALVSDRDVAANVAITAEKTRQTNLQTAATNAIAALTALTAGAAGIASVSPASGPQAGGTAVTIQGSNFTGATGATFGGTAATSFVVVSDGQITCTTPAKAAGGVTVAVADPGGNASLVGGFTYV